MARAVTPEDDSPVCHRAGRGDSPLEIRLFGTVEVRVRGALLPPLRPRKTGWLLALLALHHDRPVERSQLAGLLWPESSERLALFSLRQRLTQLRHALGPEAGRLLSPTPRTLRLDLTGAECDLLAFEVAIGRGDEASLAEASSLYRGPLLEGCLEEWVFPERRARELAAQGALETLAAAAAARAEHHTAMERLRRLLALDPLRESAARALMRSLAATGNYGAVVELYRDLRSRLRAELNSDPDPETTALFQRLRERARRPAPPAGSRPAGRDAKFHRLPCPLTPLLGREKELCEVAARVRASRLVTLTGAGGVGKTRLAIQAATELASEYAEGVCWVELAPLADPALVPQAVAAALEIRDESPRPLQDRIADLLRAADLLLVLDNCEHLLGACASLARHLLEACPGLRILATSRHHLGLPGEAVWRVPSLSVPPLPDGRDTGTGQQPQEKDALSDALGYGAVRLFAQRASQAAGEFPLTLRNLPAVVRICQRLDGIPLAIEMAAARLRALSVEQLAARLDDRFQLLADGDPTGLPRQQTLRATLDWSYDPLTAPQQRLLQRLCVFAGGWTLEAAEAVCGDCGLQIADYGVGDRSPMPESIRNPREVSAIRNPEILAILTSLVDQSLVEYQAGEGEPRYRLLETIREYSRERLQESGAEEEARRRHLAHFLELAAEAEPHLYDAKEAAWLDRLEADHDNLRAALAWGLESEPESALRLCGLLTGFWWVRGHFSEGSKHCAAALSHPEASARTQARATALNGAGILARAQGDYARAHSLFEESLGIQRECGNKHGIAVSLDNLGSVAYFRTDRAGARALHEESLAIHREIGDTQGIVSALIGLGHSQTCTPRARSFYEEALATAAGAGNRHGIARSLNALGAVAWRLGNHASARASYQEGLAIWREIGDRRGAGLALGDLGRVAYFQGDYSAARALYEESLAVMREIGDQWNIAQSLEGLGLLARERGDYPAAEARIQESLAINREVNNRWGEGDNLHSLGRVAFDQADYACAERYFREHLAMNPEPEAITSLLEAFAHLAAIQATVAIPRAVRLWGAVERWREEFVASWPLGEQQRVVRAVAAARQSLGEEAFAAAWAEGRAMTLEEAVELALAGAPG